jgi:hypothetical protein
MTQVAWNLVPPEVASQAAAHDLGAYRQAFDPAKRLRLIIPLAVLAVIFGLIAATGLAGSSSSQTSMGTATGIVVLALLVTIAWMVLTGPIGSATARARKFYVFERGYVHVGKQGVEVYRWDAVRAVYQAITRTRYNGISTGTQYAYRLFFNDGRQVKLTGLTTHMAAFGPVIAQAVATAQLPHAWQALQAGQPLTFGSFVVTRGGIAVGRKPPLAWPDVKAVEMSGGVVRVVQQGKMLGYGSSQAKDVPNLYTFLAVVQQLNGR